MSIVHAHVFTAVANAGLAGAASIGSSWTRPCVGRRFGAAHACIVRLAVARLRCRYRWSILAAIASPQAHADIGTQRLGLDQAERTDVVEKQRCYVTEELVRQLEKQRGRRRTRRAAFAASLAMSAKVAHTVPSRAPARLAEFATSVAADLRIAASAPSFARWAAAHRSRTSAPASAPKSRHRTRIIEVGRLRAARPYQAPETIEIMSGSPFSTKQIGLYSNHGIKPAGAARRLLPAPTRTRVPG